MAGGAGKSVKKEKKYTAYSAQSLAKEKSSFKEHMFELDRYGGEREVNRLITGYQGYITEEEEEILRNNRPAEPSFEILDEQKYRAQGCSKKRDYRKRVKGYFEQRERFFAQKKKGKLTGGALFAKTVADIESRMAQAEKLKDNKEDLIVDKELDKHVEKKHDKVDKKKQDQLKEKERQIAELKKKRDDLLQKHRNEGHVLEDIYEDADEMDEAYERLKTDEYAAAEKEIGAADREYHEKSRPGLKAFFNDYKVHGYTRINRCLREDRKGAIGNYKREIAYMSTTRLNRDLVVRRGVYYQRTLDAMLEDGVTREQLPELIENKKAVITEKGFMSTSLPFATSMIEAGDGGSTPGIEFIILLKKGTPAVNIAGQGDVADEGEVLVAPGTKFRIIKADMSGNADCLGVKGSWKIWLVSIPPAEEGIKKEDNAI